MSLPEAAPPAPPPLLDEELRRELLSIARASIQHGLSTGKPLSVDASRFDERLRARRGCFVTLHLRGELRGCVGNLRVRDPLVVEVARAAFSAAFRDPRFRPLRTEELDGLDIRISVLSEPVPIAFRDEADLLAQLRPGIDGVILSDGGRLGTFLPEVWAKLPDPRDFLGQLRVKAGLSREHWSSTLEVERYTTECFS